MTFEVVYSQNGVLHTIEFQAESRESAIQYFKQNQNVQLIKITQIPTKRIPLFRKSLSTKELSIVFYQFAILLNAAIPLRSLLESLAQYPHPRVAAMFAHVLSAVQNGQQLRDGFAPFYKELGIGIELIALGEKSGNLPQTLMLFVDFLRAKEQNQKRLLNALAYPLFLLVAIVGALFVIIGLLLPQFESLFASFNKQLPPLTQFLFSLQILTTPLFLAGYAISFCVLVLFWILLRQNATFQHAFDALLLRIPFIGNLLRAQHLFFYFSTMQLLFAAGFVLDNVLNLCTKTCANSALRAQLATIPSYLKQGHNLSDSMQHARVFAPIVLALIAAAQKSGEMEKMLRTAAELYGSEAAHKQSQLLALIEPLMTCLMAGVVLLIALGVFLPLWELNAVGTQW